MLSNKIIDNLGNFILFKGGTLDSDISFYTEILVVKNVFSEKYKFACLKQIPIVNIEWLYESQKKGEFI